MIHERHTISCSAYPEAHLSIEEKNRWAELQGVKTTAEGLLLPHTDMKLLDNKISPNILHAGARVKRARMEGKYVIYLPGSYDLTHIGHLSFIQQSIDHCIHTISESEQITRDDLFVVSLLDADDLVKHNKRSKHVLFGGEETTFRPIEKGFDQNGRHPRLDAVATLPVDCVSFLPAPTDTTDLPQTPYFDTHKATRVIQNYNAPLHAKEAVTRAVHGYTQLAEKITKLEAKFDEQWHIELWQLYLTLSFTQAQAHPEDMPKPYQKGGITRLISADDFKYFHEVALISNIAGIGIDKLEDIHAHSTTGLLNEFDPYQLLESKKQALASYSDLS